MASSEAKIEVSTLRSPLAAFDQEFLAAVALGEFVRRVQMSPFARAIEDEVERRVEHAFLFGSSA